MKRRELLGVLGLLWVGLSGASRAGDTPALMLAKVYRPGVPLRDYWLSEKYDGLRACWDGQRLLTRGGEAITAPDWFTAGWPAGSMDGELWIGRGRFEETLSTVRRQTPGEDAWRRVRFMVFDLPAHPGRFTERIQAFVDARDWRQFHNPKDLAIALSLEASELLENFLWKHPQDADITKIKEELADVLAYALLIAKHRYASGMPHGHRDDITSLAEFPLRFPEFDSHPGLRRMNSGRHAVFYLTLDDRIEIVRVVHVASDFERWL